MKSVQSKILLVLLLFTHVILPMKPFPMIKSVLHEVERSALPVLVTLENYTSLGVLVFQAAAFVWLKKKNSLFDTGLIPKKINIAGCFSLVSKNVIALGAFFGLLFTSMFSRINRLPQECIHSDANSIINTLLLASSLIHVSNLTYDDALASLEHLPIDFIIKNKLDISVLDAKCEICYEDTLDKEYVNPCEQKDHIFCKTCLHTCFENQKKQSNFASNSFLCELCRQKISFNDEKSKLILSPKKITLELLLQKTDWITKIIYCIGIYAFTNLMLCQFS